jgi:hypothetical protein
VLVIQPAINDPIVKVEIDGQVVFSEETDEKNFRRYLHATEKAIHQSVRDGLFEIDKNIIIPKGDSYHCNEYQSRKEWEEDRLTFCEDWEALTTISEKIKKIVKGRTHKVLEYWKEHQVLLRKIG